MHYVCVACVNIQKANMLSSHYTHTQDTSSLLWATVSLAFYFRHVSLVNYADYLSSNFQVDHLFPPLSWLLWQTINTRFCASCCSRRVWGVLWDLCWLSLKKLVQFPESSPKRIRKSHAVILGFLLHPSALFPQLDVSRSSVHSWQSDRRPDGQQVRRTLKKLQVLPRIIVLFPVKMSNQFFYT